MQGAAPPHTLLVSDVVITRSWEAALGISLGEDLAVYGTPLRVARTRGGGEAHVGATATAGSSGGLLWGREQPRLSCLSCVRAAGMEQGTPEDAGPVARGGSERTSAACWT